MKWLACHSLSSAIILLRQRKTFYVFQANRHTALTHTHTVSHTHTHKCTLSAVYTQAHSLSYTETHTQNQAFEPQTEDGCEKSGQSVRCLVRRKQQSRAEGPASKSPAFSVAADLEEQVCLPGWHLSNEVLIVPFKIYMKFSKVSGWRVLAVMFIVTTSPISCFSFYLLALLVFFVQKKEKRWFFKM